MFKYFFILLLPLFAFAEKYDLQDNEWHYEIRRGDTLDSIILKTAGPHLKQKNIPRYKRMIKNANLQIEDWKKLGPGNELDLDVLKSTYKEVIQVKGSDIPDYYLPSYRGEAFYSISSATFKESFDNFSIQGDKLSVQGFGMKGIYGTSHNPVHYRLSAKYMDLNFDEFQVRDYHFTVMDFNHFENLNFYYTYRHRILNFRSLDSAQAVRIKDNKLHFIGAGAQFYFYFLDRKVQFDSSANILGHSVNEENERESFGSIVDFTASYSPIDYLEAEGFIDFIYLNGGGRVLRSIIVGINMKIYFEI